jgi:hypothetical protein
MHIYTVLSVKLSDIMVSLSRTAHSAGWDADISVQIHEAAHQYHCPSHHFLIAEIKEYWLSNGSFSSS